MIAAICGSNSATAATMSTIALPELKKYNYDEALSTGAVAAGGTLGIIIPPSTVLIVIAIQTQQSVRELFAATIIPGLMLTLLFLAMISYICMRHPEHGPAGPKTPLKEKLLSLKDVIPVFLLFVFVLGGLFLGWFTPTHGLSGCDVFPRTLRCTDRYFDRVSSNCFICRQVDDEAKEEDSRDQS